MFLPLFRQILPNSKKVLMARLIPFRFTSSDVKFQNDSQNQTFYVDFNGDKAFIEYEKVGNNIRLIHTEVPSKLEGRGLAKVLAKGAFEHVAKNNLKMEIECEFLQHYIEKYANEYKKYLK